MAAGESLNDGCMGKHNGKPWTIPALVADDRLADAAAAVLGEYFAEEEGQPKYTEAMFERFAGGGDRDDKNVVTSEDLLAMTLLSAAPPGRAVLQLTPNAGAKTDLADRVTKLLKRIPADVDLVDATDDHLAAAEELLKLVGKSMRGADGTKVGRERASKLLARKRPRMLPVLDEAVSGVLGHRRGRTDYYEMLRAALRADSQALHKHLLRVRKEAGELHDISVLRCFDALVWLPSEHPDAVQARLNARRSRK